MHAMWLSVMEKAYFGHVNTDRLLNPTVQNAHVPVILTAFMDLKKHSTRITAKEEKHRGMNPKSFM